MPVKTSGEIHSGDQAVSLSTTSSLIMDELANVLRLTLDTLSQSATTTTSTVGQLRTDPSSERTSTPSIDPSIGRLESFTLCPRCGEVIEYSYRRALSRVDNATYICSTCGLDEAVISSILRKPLSKDDWWINKPPEYIPEA